MEPKKQNPRKRRTYATHIDKKFKVALVGDYNVGKSSFIKKHITGEIAEEYDATLNLDISTLIFNTNYGVISLAIWDFAGFIDDATSNYLLNCDAAIIMFSLGSLYSYNNATNWIQYLQNGLGDLPIVICGNKSDLRYKEVQIDNTFFDISAKTGHNIDKPFLFLIRTLMEKGDLVFTEI